MITSRPQPCRASFLLRYSLTQVKPGEPAVARFMLPPLQLSRLRSEMLYTELSEVLLDIIQGGCFRLVYGTIKPVLMGNADADRNE